MALAVTRMYIEIYIFLYIVGDGSIADRLWNGARHDESYFGFYCLRQIERSPNIRKINRKRKMHSKHPAPYGEKQRKVDIHVYREKPRSRIGEYKDVSCVYDCYEALLVIRTAIDPEDVPVKQGSLTQIDILKIIFVMVVFLHIGTYLDNALYMAILCRQHPTERLMTHPHKPTAPNQHKYYP